MSALVCICVLLAIAYPYPVESLQQDPNAASGGGGGVNVISGANGKMQASALDAAISDMSPLTQERVALINELLKDSTPQQILQWAAKAMPGRIVQFTSFGPSGMVILDMLRTLGLLKEMPVITIDTLHLFRETYTHVKNVSERYPGMKLHVYYPKGFSASQRYKFDVVFGSDLWADDFEKYTYLTKVEPTQRALREMDPYGWITGRRRSQGGERQNLTVVGYDEGRMKINPLASWTSEQVWQYIHAHGVPYNNLHDVGYASIGDDMNTRPVRPGEPERAGRFQHSGKNTTECGMHAHLAKANAAKKQGGGDKPKKKIPHLECSACLEVDEDTFEELVLGAKKDILIEFFSPLCGHCQHFAPTFAEVAQKLLATGDVIPARMDMVRNRVPRIGMNAGFKVSGFPTLYLARQTGSAGKLKLLRFDGWRTTNGILDWVVQHRSQPVDVANASRLRR